MPNPEGPNAVEEPLPAEERIKVNSTEAAKALRTSIDAARQVVADVPVVVLNAAINKKDQLKQAANRGLDALAAVPVTGPYAPILALGSTIHGEIEEAKGDSSPLPAVDRFTDALYQYGTIGDATNALHEADARVMEVGRTLIDSVLAKAKEELTPSENQPASPQAPTASPETNPPSNS